jgi:hypothetical protein
MVEIRAVKFDDLCRIQVDGTIEEAGRIIGDELGNAMGYGPPYKVNYLGITPLTGNRVFEFVWASLRSS